MTTDDFDDDDAKPGAFLGLLAWGAIAWVVLLVVGFEFWHLV